MPPESAAGSTPLLRPDWPASSSVGAAMSLRAGGISPAPWTSLNLGDRAGDDVRCVQENRRRFAAGIGAAPVWLRQVHGTQVLRVGAAHAAGGEYHADAAWTDEAGIACTVQVADCLPVLLAAPRGRAVAAAHAGWRGLSAGVVEATLAALCAGAGCAAQDVQVWLGPCIGARRFEVGEEVLRAFGRVPRSDDTPGFVARHRSDGTARWLADLHALARERLARCGVSQIGATARCTVAEAVDFFSYRRDGVTGRNAAAIWIRR